MDYIDVRGVWPVYINGFITVELVGEDRNITIGRARGILGLRVGWIDESGS
jgi:hypothetical protein